MQKVKDFFLDLVLNKGVQLLWSLFLILACYIVAKIILKAIKRVLLKSRMEKITVSFLMSIIKFVVYMLLLLIIAQIFGIPMTGLIALLGTAGLAIGLALQDSLSNLANGIVIITTKPFHEGDFVKIGGVEGKVKNIRILTTALITTDGKLAILPNSEIVTSEIINYNILGRRRVDFTFGVAYESDIKLVRDIIMNVITSNGKVLMDPAPFVSLKTLNSSSIDFFANCWVDAEDYWEVYYYVTEHVFNEFKKNNISIPYNQVEVRLRDDDVVMPVNNASLPIREEKVRIQKFEGDILEQIIHEKKEKMLSRKEEKARLKAEKKAQKEQNENNQD